uniref:Nucleolus and neural progenitor protein-like N-terminal domain-containing protein n=1 Tax=Ananas comosus var. bracteatus TaxID=296719 RepID=A0A6V7QYA9_ANACO
MWSLLSQLDSEAGVLDRIVYKNKNQHRRCSYFQFLLKVRRDLRLVELANLPEILNVVFPIISGKKPAQKALHPIRVNRKCPNVKHNCQERLLGVARILSQLAEPIIKGATQISLLLAKSFFTGFSTMVLALLARLRVLVQQILLDVVSIFNKISALSQTKHSVKIAEGGIEAFREYYPSRGDALFLELECVWEEDKFVLIERTQNSCKRCRDEDQSVAPSGTLIQYETMAHFGEDQSIINGDKKDSFADGANMTRLVTAAEDIITESADSIPTPNPSELPPQNRKRVAFISVGKLAPSPAVPNKKAKLDAILSNVAEADDPFASLPFPGISNNSVF